MAWMILMKCAGQARTSMAGFSGLDATAIIAMLDLYKIKCPLVLDLLLTASDKISTLLRPERDDGAGET